MDRRTFLRTTAVVAGGAAVAGCTAESPGSEGSRPEQPVRAMVPEAVDRPVRTGFDVLADSAYAQVRGQRVGLVSNPTGVVRDLRHEVDVMVGSGDIDLVAAFGPEHGFRGNVRVGGSGGAFRDPRTGLRVYDTYGKNAAAIAELFRRAGVDTVMFDIQDVGARFYTYIWTMYDCMVAASRAGVRFVVLDRPNPISAQNAFGPVLHPQHATFVGRRPISQQHAMTVGELAGLFNAEFLPDDAGAKGPADLAVSRLDGWTRSMYADQTGQPWVMPSPSMPRLETAVVYPGTCLFEATNMSEGRGTSRPFELVGAPYADYHWADALNRQELDGVDFREAYFVPVTSKYQDKTCAGVQLHVTDRDAFDAIRTAIAMIVTARRLYPQAFDWREPTAPYWIDKLTGSGHVRRAVDAGADTDDVVAGWRHDLREFRRTRAEYLLYPRDSGVAGAGG
jgi:uncharacterized protein YbbC (DUF1343 family)